MECSIYLMYGLARVINRRDWKTVSVKIESGCQHPSPKNYFDFSQFENVVFRILKIQFLTKVFLNFKGALWFLVQIFLLFSKNI